MFKPQSILAADIAALRDRLMATSVGETVTYQQLSRVIGADVQARRYLVLRALDLANKESGSLFVNVRTVGYQRLEAERAALVGVNLRRRIRRSTRRAAGAITRAVEVANDMTANGQARAYAEASALQLIGYLARDRHVAQIVSPDKPTPVGTTLTMMASRLGIGKEQETTP